MVKQKQKPPRKLRPGLVYGCSCGKTFEELSGWRSHVMSSKDPAGTHKSLGVLNAETKEVVMPPYSGRSEFQVDHANWILFGDGTPPKEGYAPLGILGEAPEVEEEETGAAGSSSGGGNGSKSNKAAFHKNTADPNSASLIRFVPKVLTVTYTPILRAAQAAAAIQWGWPADDPLEDFIDTVVHNYFREHGIRLSAFEVMTPEEIRQENEAAEAVVEGNGNGSKGLCDPAESAVAAS